MISNLLQQLSIELGYPVLRLVPGLFQPRAIHIDLREVFR
jgi:hypothetical protein